MVEGCGRKSQYGSQEAEKETRRVFKDKIYLSDPLPPAPFGMNPSLAQPLMKLNPHGPLTSLVSLARVQAFST
jgi:hypothetical protein